jgi:PKD repeat protein
MQAQFRLRSKSQVHPAGLRITMASLLLSGLIEPTAPAAPVTLRWEYVASGAAGFVLYCGPSSRNYPTRIDVGNTDTYTIGTLMEGATSYCAVTAYDPARVESEHSVELAFSVPYSAPVVGFNASPGSGAPPLNVAFTNTTTGQVTSWVWNFGDGTTSNLKSPTHSYTTAGSFNPTLTATGPGGTATKTATTAIAVSATTGSDTTPPSKPTGPVAKPMSSARIDLSWNASTDNVAIRRYRVERCSGASCTNFVQVARVAGTTFSNTALTSSTNYRFRVRAVDTTGNLSGYSSIVSAKTLAQ